MHKISILDGLQTNPGDLSWEPIAQYGSTTVYDDLTYDEETIVKRIGDADIVITVDVPINESILQKCPNILYVGAMSTGHNHVDGKACSLRGIPVTNVPSYSTFSVSQRAIALLLTLSDNACLYSQKVHEGEWNKPFPHWEVPTMELEGKTLGIIGYGAIGKRTATIAKAFGMKILAYSRHLVGTGDETAEFVSLERIFQESDVLSLHTPLNADSLHLINRESLQKMKDGVRIVNTSRGGLIDEEALAEALQSGKVAGAAVDVLSEEPANPNNPLLHAPNVIITPHTAWTGKNARATLIQETGENLKAFLEGKDRNRVNE